MPSIFRSITRSRAAAAAVAVAVLSAPIAVFAAGSGARTGEAAYLSENNTAMAKMMDERMARMHERFQRHATAVKALYAVLNPEQRRTLDALPALMGRGTGMAMGHRGGMDKPGAGARRSADGE